MVENPFFHRGPIRDPMYFCNRKTEVKRALEMLGKGQSISVIGPRKIGKTSFLFHISQPEVMRQHGLDPTRYLFVCINCEGLSNLDRQALYVLILEEVVEKSAQQGYDFKVPDRLDSYISFEHGLRIILKCKLNLILLFDEFESLTENPNLGAEFFDGLRALNARFDVAYVTASQRRLSDLSQSKDSSAFFNIFSPIDLGLFDKTESEELIKSYMRNTETTLGQQVIDTVLDLGGGHPYFLQVASYWALELQSTKGSPLESKDFRILEQTLCDQLASHLEYYWGHLLPREQYVLAALPLTQSEEIHREELDSLNRLCLIAKKDGRYEYFSPLFRDFVRRQKVPNILQAGPFVLSISHQVALLRERPLPLGAKQLALLTYLMERQGQVVSNEELDREALTLPEDRQKYEYISDERLKSVIKELRKALGDEEDCIVNKRRVGYMFQAQTEDQVWSGITLSRRAQ